MAKPVQQRATCCVQADNKKYVIEFQADIDFLKAEVHKQLDTHSPFQPNRQIKAFNYIHPYGKTVTIVSNECIDAALKCFPSSQLFEMQCIFQEKSIQLSCNAYSINS